MIQRLRKVTDGLYRGSAPSPKDVAWLKDNLAIKKIVSLDRETGDKIDRACNLLGIKHVKIPIEMDNFKKTLINFFKHDLKKLFLEDGPVFVHCRHGKDRTGFAAALVETKYLNKTPEDAIEDAKSLGFGVGVDPQIIGTLEKLIRSSKHEKDTNNADIVSNEREYISDNRDSFLDEGHQGSFAPHLNVTRQNPMDAVYNYINDQSPTRENYNQSRPINQHIDEDIVPLVGLYNNNAGIHGAGPAEPVGGFISD